MWRFGMEKDYPKTLAEFEHRFATDEACLDYLAQLRSGDSFTPPSAFGCADFCHMK